MNNNGFTLTFGQIPHNYIERSEVTRKIITDFSLDFPSFHSYIITGIRASGKTVLLTKVSKLIQENSLWIIIDINPNREILPQIAAGLYENESIKKLFLDDKLSISFKGYGIKIKGKENVSNIKTLVEILLKVAKDNNKRILLTIDEVSNNNNFVNTFIRDFESFLRDDYPIFLLMSGLYENVFLLQNSKNLTFIYRSPKIDLKPLDLNLIAKEYQKIFPNTDEETINKLAKLTKGYAFAFQVIGLLFSKYNDVGKIYGELDDYLSIYVYDKIWESLPEGEKKILFCFDKDFLTTNEIISRTKLNSKTYSVYRDRLIRRGILNGDKYGILELTLPRFEVFISKQIY